MIVTLGLRTLQIIFSAITLGLAAVLISKYGPGSAPALYSYGAFCGGASILFALVGVAACFVEKLQGLIMLALDGLTTIFLLAGGIAYAATLKVGSCSDVDYLARHSKSFVSDDKILGDGNDSGLKLIKLWENFAGSQCKLAQADTAFIWFTFACAAGCLVLSMLTKTRGSSSIV